MIAVLRKHVAIALLPLCLGLAACADMNQTEQRALTGGAIGAGTGASITLITGGCLACGTVVGGAMGAAGGYVYDQLENTN